jgi:CRISPR-associated protein Csb2
MMFALGIRYLNGWAMAAADGAKKERAEWPPHPDRVFMALAAAHFEGDRLPTHREALQWIEQQPAPAIAASDHVQRETVTHYVPVNDSSSPAIKPDKLAVASAAQIRGGIALLPEHRSRQPRQFPVAVPLEDTVQLIWRDIAIPEQHAAALRQLCAQVTCVGHSASLVQMWVSDQPSAPTWQPTDHSQPGPRMRVPSPGRLQSLEAAYNEAHRLSWLQMERAIAQAKGKRRIELKAERKQQFDDTQPSARRPPPGLWRGYERISCEAPEQQAISGVFSERLLVFRQVGGRRLGLESTLILTQAARDFVLGACSVQPPPEWISGHAANRSPTPEPHLAVLPLAHVGHEHAHGHLLGFALAVPRSIEPAEIGRCLLPLFDLDLDGVSKPFTLYAGKHLEARFQFDLADHAPRALEAETWIASAAGAATWATVTPIVLDRHGKSGDRWQDAEQTIKLACERIGLPSPLRVEVGSTSQFIGAPSVGGRRAGYPPLLRKDGSRRQHLHAVVTFAQPVRGPVLLGAGRFRGYGLCRPLYGQLGART